MVRGEICLSELFDIVEISRGALVVVEALACLLHVSAHFGDLGVHVFLHLTFGLSLERGGRHG